ncbi:hypothetical protein AMATHDRAFT_4737 [Amanita thiersii Skay4041]|uniref:Uncharacterized protein n=1 Tax=Amanita thiersii Skay4041 TaxID=703135 RepID=A0A2A9NN17_9AGAR|nr:hypothetical protein AMATHDRAFT_4737 [Amanita thiersii Skay4041]
MNSFETHTHLFLVNSVPKKASKVALGGCLGGAASSLLARRMDSFVNSPITMAMVLRLLGLLAIFAQELASRFGDTALEDILSLAKTPVLPLVSDSLVNFESAGKEEDTKISKSGISAIYQAIIDLEHMVTLVPVPPPRLQHTRHK